MFCCNLCKFFAHLFLHTSRTTRLLNFKKSALLSELSQEFICYSVTLIEIFPHFLVFGRFHISSSFFYILSAFLRSSSDFSRISRVSLWIYCTYKCFISFVYCLFIFFIKLKLFSLMCFNSHHSFFFVSHVIILLLFHSSCIISSLCCRSSLFNSFQKRFSISGFFRFNFSLSVCLSFCLFTFIIF